MHLNDEELKARFKELTEKHDKIRAVSDPIRAKRDALSQEADKKLKELAIEIKSAEDGLFAIEMERAKIARALKGKTS